MLIEKIDLIENKLEAILQIHEALPTWTPLSKRYAKECGYKTIDGLRAYCLNNINPDHFQKFDGKWYLHVSILHKVKRRV